MRLSNVLELIVTPKRGSNGKVVGGQEPSGPDIVSKNNCYIAKLGDTVMLTCLIQGNMEVYVREIQPSDVSSSLDVGEKVRIFVRNLLRFT